MDRILKMIDGIYDAVFDDGGWNRLATALASGLEAASSNLHLHPPAGQAGRAMMLGFTDYCGPAGFAAYEAHYHRIDPWVTRDMAAGVDTPRIGQMLVSDREFRRSEYYNDWARPIGIFNVMGAVITVSPGVYGVVGVHRPEGRDPFAPEQRRLLEVLLPHLGRAMRMQQRLAGLVRDRRIALDALDTLTVGVLLVAADGRLLFANGRAERHLRSGQGITLRHGRLVARDRPGDRRLQHAIHTACATGSDGAAALAAPGGLMALPRPDGRPLSVMVCPFAPDGIAARPVQPVALVFIGDNDDGLKLAPGIFSGLSPAEARLAAALVEGGRLDDYADHAGIALETARTQLKRVLAKTGCGRQSELVRLALSDPIARMAGRRGVGF